jgi:hypothetical protein
LQAKSLGEQVKDWADQGLLRGKKGLPKHRAQRQLRFAAWLGSSNFQGDAAVEELEARSPKLPLTTYRAQAIQVNRSDQSEGWVFCWTLKYAFASILVLFCNT